MVAARQYEPVLSEKALVFLLSLSRPRQRRLAALLFQLAQDPFTLGEYKDTDEDGHVIEHITLGDYRVKFWSDHAVCELRVVVIEPR